jgi:SAM-dependent methyltransferase
MHPLLVDSIQALDEPSFRELFETFLVLQRYDLMPYVRLFGTLPDIEQARRGTVTVGDEEIKAARLVADYVDVLRHAPRPTELPGLAEAFWKTFAEAVGDRGPRECLAARRELEPEYERNFMLPLLQPQLRQLAPKRVLDFGCGLNRLAPVLQDDLRLAGLSVPTVIGVDVRVSADATVDPERDIQLHDIHDRPLSTVLDAPVDLVIANYVLHHMTAAAQGTVMNDLAAALAPEGRLLILEASVGTDDDDLTSFEHCLSGHTAWPSDAWAEPYRAWSRRFYRADCRTQSMLMCLEDTFGHVFLPGSRPGHPPMPLPYTYVGRTLLTEATREAGLQPDPELSVVLGLPPGLKYGPPSSLHVFRHARPA